MGVAAARILHVDGRATTRAAVERALAQLGFDVVGVGTAAEGLGLLAREELDLVLLDADLPDRGGRDVLRTLRADPATAILPVVYVAARPLAPCERAQALDAGADAALTHPLDPEELRATIEVVLRARRAERALAEALDAERGARARAQAAEARASALLAEVEEQARIARARADLAQQLIGVVSHDLRNPLGVVSMAAHLILRGPEDAVRARELALRIASASGRASRLIRDLLDFTRARLAGGLQLAPAPADLHDLAARAVEELRLSHPQERIELSAAGDGRGVWDADRIAQILVNLVSNALRHRAPGTAVRVGTDGAGPAPTLTVFNEGDPIPDELRGRLFEPLSRGTTAGHETRSIGLGLFIVRQIASAHGGAVAVESGEGGTRFTVTLPREPAAAAAPAPPPRREAEGRAGPAARPH